MIEYTYFELFLMCAFFIALGFALKYREESIKGKHFVKMLVENDKVYAKVKAEYNSFKEMRHAD